MHFELSPHTEHLLSISPRLRSVLLDVIRASSLRDGPTRGGLSAAIFEEIATGLARGGTWTADAPPSRDELARAADVLLDAVSRAVGSLERTVEREHYASIREG